MRKLLSAIHRMLGAEPGPRAAKTILFAWEMGDGMGHLNRLLPLAKALADRGFGAAFALRTVENAPRIRASLPHAKILSAPPAPSRPPGQVLPAHTYADLLHRNGYARVEDLTRQVGGWRQILSQTKPDLVVCDHSPTLVLSASGVVPTVHLGSGFATPPTRHRFMVLHEGSSRGARERQAEVLESIRAVQKSLGQAPLENLTDLFTLTALHVPCCLPELDPYRGIRREPAPGTMQALPGPAEMPDEPFVFGYLSARDGRVARIVEALATAEIRAGIFVRDDESGDVARLAAGSSVTIYDTPQPMPDALFRATAVVHHGGLSTAEQALAAGRPQFILPRHLEQTMTAEAVVRLGCGVNVGTHKGDFTAAVTRAVQARTFDRKAQAVAERLAERPMIDVKAYVVARCEELLGGTKGATHRGVPTEG